MHTYETKNGTLFHYNSDLSGEIIIMKNGTSVEISADDLDEFRCNVQGKMEAIKIFNGQEFGKDLKELFEKYNLKSIKPRDMNATMEIDDNGMFIMNNFHVLSKDSVIIKQKGPGE